MFYIQVVKVKQRYSGARGLVDCGYLARATCQHPIKITLAAAEQAKVPAGPKFCTNCGTKIAPDAKFCTGCGNPQRVAGAAHGMQQLSIGDGQPAQAPWHPQSTTSLTEPTFFAPKKDSTESCTFNFLDANFVRKYTGTKLPFFQELRKHLIKMKLTYAEVISGQHVEENLSVSHR